MDEKRRNTYDESLKELIQEYNCLKLTEKAEKIRNMDEEELVELKLDERR